MKTIVSLLLLAGLALLFNLNLAALGLALVAGVLLIGDLVQPLPPSPCRQNCQQGDHCTCPLANRSLKK